MTSDSRYRIPIVGHGEGASACYTGLVMERWRLVVGFEGGYEVSDLGRVRRVGAGRGSRVDRVLRTRANNSGYQVVGLWMRNRPFHRLLHRLVAVAFLGTVPPGHEVNHINLTKSDCRAANLEYVTRGENLRHRAAVGIGRGEQNGASKLTENQVRAIRTAHQQGVGYKRLAREHGVSPRGVRAIVKRSTWGWLAPSDQDGEGGVAPPPALHLEPRLAP